MITLICFALVIIFMILLICMRFRHKTSENYCGRTYYHIPLVSPWGTRPNRLGLIHYGDVVGHCPDACSGSNNRSACLAECKDVHLLN